MLLRVGGQVAGVATIVVVGLVVDPVPKDAEAQRRRTGGEVTEEAELSEVSDVAGIAVLHGPSVLCRLLSGIRQESEHLHP